MTSVESFRLAAVAPLVEPAEEPSPDGATYGTGAGDRGDDEWLPLAPHMVVGAPLLFSRHVDPAQHAVAPVACDAIAIVLSVLALGIVVVVLLRSIA